MSRISLPRHAKDEGRRKTKIQSLDTLPIDIGEPFKKRVKRVAKGPVISNHPVDNNPNPVYAKKSVRKGIGLVPSSIRKNENSKQRYLTSPDFKK